MADTRLQHPLLKTRGMHMPHVTRALGGRRLVGRGHLSAQAAKPRDVHCGAELDDLLRRQVEEECPAFGKSVVACERIQSRTDTPAVLCSSALYTPSGSASSIEPPHSASRATKMETGTHALEEQQQRPGRQ